MNVRIRMHCNCVLLCVNVNIQFHNLQAKTSSGWLSCSSSFIAWTNNLVQRGEPFPVSVCYLIILLCIFAEADPGRAFFKMWQLIQI